MLNTKSDSDMLGLLVRKGRARPTLSPDSPKPASSLASHDIHENTGKVSGGGLSDLISRRGVSIFRSSNTVSGEIQNHQQANVGTPDDARNQSMTDSPSIYASVKMPARHQLTVRLAYSLYERFRAYSKQSNKSYQDTIVDAIAHYLDFQRETSLSSEIRQTMVKFSNGKFARIIK